MSSISIETPAGTFSPNIGSAAERYIRASDLRWITGSGHSVNRGKLEVVCGCLLRHVPLFSAPIRTADFLAYFTRRYVH